MHFQHNELMNSYLKKYAFTGCLVTLSSRLKCLPASFHNFVYILCLSTSLSVDERRRAAPLSASEGRRRDERRLTVAGVTYSIK